ncbi:MAG: hypothetical protein ABIO39_13710, partial [Caulobacteraceae bacterium]
SWERTLAPFIASFYDEARFEIQREPRADWIGQMNCTRFGARCAMAVQDRLLWFLAAVVLGLASNSQAQIGKMCDDLIFVVPFDPGSGRLTPVARAGLAGDLARIRGCRAERLIVAGFGDPLRPMSEMRDLGERRSLAVALALGRLGVPAALITTRIGATSLAREGALGGSARVIVRLSGRLP